jgi:tetratricopeptide (TPR) repeat protein
MGKKLRISWLLVALLSLPLLSSAQSSESKYAVSVRDLSIPPKALHAYQQGAVLLLKKDAVGSLPYFQRAVAGYAGYYEAFYEIGVANLKLLRVPEAEEAFRRSIELSGGQYVRSQFALGAVLEYREQFAEAEGVVRKGLDLDAASWTGHYYLARALLGLNRMEEAEKSVREALSRKANSVEALRLLADIHGAEKDYRALLNDLDEYLKVDPDSPTAIRARSLRDTAQRMLAESPSTIALAEPQH